MIPGIEPSLSKGLAAFWARRCADCGSRNVMAVYLSDDGEVCLCRRHYRFPTEAVRS